MKVAGELVDFIFAQRLAGDSRAGFVVDGPFGLAVSQSALGHFRRHWVSGECRWECGCEVRRREPAFRGKEDISELPSLPAFVAVRLFGQTSNGHRLMMMTARPGGRKHRKRYTRQGQV